MMHFSFSKSTGSYLLKKTKQIAPVPKETCKNIVGPYVPVVKGGGWGVGTVQGAK